MDEPAFDLSVIDPGIYERVPLLAETRLRRLQLIKLQTYITSCKEVIDSQRLLTHLHIPGHMFSSPDVYALHDLVELESLNSLLHELMEAWTTHIAECSICRSKGSRCAICSAHKLIYPFMLGIVSECAHCNGVFHSVCLEQYIECPVCHNPLQ